MDRQLALIWLCNSRRMMGADDLELSNRFVFFVGFIHCICSHIKKDKSKIIEHAGSLLHKHDDFNYSSMDLQQYGC